MRVAGWPSARHRVEPVSRIGNLTLVARTGPCHGDGVGYTVAQLRLLILLGLILLVGLGVREWRAGFPDAAERFERFDREEAMAPLRPEPSLPSPTPVAGPTVAPSAAATSLPTEPIDVNRADATDLVRLPGVGAGLAQRIVEERERRGRFDSPEALRDVLGMGPKKLAAIRRFITVSE
jgi:competence ComEA-like helix-hairpin-helix protein